MGFVEATLWSGEGYIDKKAIVAWDRVCCPKSAGGMGLTNMQLWNKAAAVKVCWDLANKVDKLWIKWIHTSYIKEDQGQWLPHS